MKILRVFPKRTTQTPIDGVVGFPGLWREDADEVHISTVFTWDIPTAERLRKSWADYYPVVKVGGPAYGDPGGEFTPGMYVKAGIVFTSRGCPNRCDFCLVPEREGCIRELEVKDGHIVQDNNLLACSRNHIERVFRMLRQQKKSAIFAGGLEPGRISLWVVDAMRGLRIRELFLAFDSWGKEKAFAKAMRRLKDFPRRKLRTFVLIGRDGIDRDRERLERAWELGALPFAQLYQPATHFIEYPQEYKTLARNWSRPAIMRTIMKKVSC